MDVQGPRHLKGSGDNAREQVYKGLVLLCFLFSAFLPFFIANTSLQMSALIFLALIVGLLCTIYLEAGILLLFLVSPVIVIGERAFGDYKLCLAALVLVLWAIKKMHDKESLAEILGHPLVYFVIAFSILGFFSVMAAADTKASLKFFMKHMGNLVFLFIFLDMFKSKRIIYRIIFCLLLASVLESLYGLFEFAVNIKKGTFEAMYRSSGTFQHPNIFGRYLSLVFVFIVALVLDTKNKRTLFLYIASGIVILSAILVSFSRSALTGIFVGCLFLIPMYFKLRIRSFINISMAVTFCLLNVIFISGLIKTFAADEQLSMSAYEAGVGLSSGKASVIETVSGAFSRQLSRENIWDTSRKMVLDHPILGCGVGMIGPASTEYLETDYLDTEISLDRLEKEGVVNPDEIPNAHNLFLQVMVEMGIGGAVLMLWLYYVIFTHVRKNLALVTDNTQRILLLGGAACVINDLFMGLFEPANMFGPGSLGFLFVFFASLVFASPKIRPS